VLDGARVILAARVALLALSLDVVLSFAAAPEGVAVPLAATFGRGPAAAGLLLAAMTAGSAAGYLGAGWWAADPDGPRFAGLARCVPLLALAGPGILIAFAARPGVAWGCLVLFASGACCGYMVVTGAVFAGAIRNEDRGKAFGTANAALVGGQGVVLLAAGGLAAAIGPARALAVCGAAGVACAVPLGLAWRRKPEPEPEG
jgi:hypothetical protein